MYYIVPYWTKPRYRASVNSSLVSPSNKSLLSINTTALIVGSAAPFSLLLLLFHAHDCTPRFIVLPPSGQSV